MSVRINLGNWGSVFAVPSSIVDLHIKIASPLQLKVILFLLRNNDKSYSCEELSEILSAHIEDIKDSIDFWVEREVICKNDKCYEPAKTIAYNEFKEDKKEEKVKNSTVRLVKPDMVDVAQKISVDESLQHLLAEVESAFAKPLSRGDTSTIVMLYDTCGLPCEVIAMLVHYCISIGKGNFRTIEKIGIEWADNGINSLEKAENKILEIKQSNDYWNTVKSVFGLKNVGSPTKKQLEYANRWIGEWHFSFDMLRIAYEKCVDQTGSMSMAYINKILKQWYDAKIFKPEDIDKVQNKTNAKQTKKSKASYDIEELEKIQ